MNKINRGTIFPGKRNLWIGLSPLILSLIIALFMLTTLGSLPAKLPLFYSLPWGPGQLATHQQFLIIPGLISIVALLNLFISWQLHPSQSFFKKLLLLSPFIISLILTVTFIKIILIFV